MFRSLRTVALVGAAVVGATTVAFAVVPAATTPVAASPPTPVIASFTPAAAAVGSPVTINGSNLSGATAIAFNLIQAPITTDTASQITTTVPLGEDQGPITVTTPGGTATSSTTFTLEGFYVATATLKDAVVGTHYSVQLEGAGGTGPYRWSHRGALPKGLTMSRLGVISGVPSIAKATVGTYSFTVTVRDSTRHHHLTASSILFLTVSSNLGS